VSEIGNRLFRSAVPGVWTSRGMRGQGVSGTSSSLKKLVGVYGPCFKIARSVPSGMSPGWLGTVVYSFAIGLN
jgi:hypothetical protein